MRKYKRVRFLAIIFLLFWFPAISIYLDYNSLVEADFLFGGFQFEVPGLEDLLADNQDFHFISGQTLLSNPLETIVFSFIFASFWQGIIPSPKASTLRC